MRCQLCRKRAVYGELRFCKEHFLAYYEKKVKHYLERTHTRNTSVLIAVSGGKDSSALVDILVTLSEAFNLKLGLFTINLRIPNYSEKGLAVVKALAKEYKLPLIIEDLKEHPHQIPDFAEGKPCSQCGVIKRYLLNKNAWEHGYDYLATGHNLDDEFYTALHNLLHRNPAQLRRQEKRLPPKPALRLAGRLKPLYELTEKENRLYCLLKGIPHDADECPYSRDNPHLRAKAVRPFPRDQKRNLLKTLQKLQEPAVSEDEKLHACPVCGYPTTSEVCVYCKIMQR